MTKPILLGVLMTFACSEAPAQNWAKARLEKSPRHQEWVKVKQGRREVQCFVVFPEVKDKATAVVVIHEIFGLSDWARSVADQLAEAGYIAIAPDLLSGMAPGGGGTSEFAERDAITKAVSSLPPDQVTADLEAVVQYVRGLPACNGRVTAGGFCWGGSQVFRLATNQKDLKAAFAFYGTGPDREEDLGRIRCPVYGFYGGEDARVTATVPKSTELMQKAGKRYEPVIYPGAGHGFMRAGEEPGAKEANRDAHDQAWKRWLELLRTVRD
jgi:carboxymethylenebutenolidase